ncbi:MAG: hypothetical protein AAGD22_11745 [Verrucomicrobiota bacterium]
MAWASFGVGEASSQASVSLPKWTNDEGVTIEAELLGYDVETGEISLGKADGTAYNYPARELSLESKLRLFNEPFYLDATKGREIPYDRLWRPLLIGLGIWMGVQFLVFWIGVAVVVRDDSLVRALGAFLKYFIGALLLHLFLGFVGYFFFVSETGEPDMGWWLGITGLMAFGSLWIFCASVRGSYETGWVRAVLAFLLCLVLYVGLGIVVGLLGERWIASDHANRMLTERVFVPLEML